MDFFAEHFAKFVFFPGFKFLLQAHNQIFDAVRIGDVAKNKPFFFGGGLDEKIAVIEKSGDNAFHISGDVLDVFQFQFRNRSGEKSFLFNVHDAPVGDDPNIKIVINPNNKESNPSENEKKIARESYERIINWIGELSGKEKREKITAEKKKQHYKNNEKLAENIEPVAMKNRQDFFIRMLSVKMICCELIFHGFKKLLKLSRSNPPKKRE